MAKFSKADQAHFWIPFVVLLLVSVVQFIFSWEIGTIKEIYLWAIIILLLLQSGNELFQYLDKDRDKKYGSRQGFLENSKKDWTMFLLGLFGGSFLFFLTVILKVS